MDGTVSHAPQKAQRPLPAGASLFAEDKIGSDRFSEEAAVQAAHDDDDPLPRGVARKAGVSDQDGLRDAYAPVEHGPAAEDASEPGGAARLHPVPLTGRERLVADPRKDVPAAFQLLLDSGSRVRFRGNDKDWLANYRLAALDVALSAQDAPLTEEQTEQMAALFQHHAGADGRPEAKALTVETTPRELASVDASLDDQVMAVAESYEAIYEETGRILDERQMAAFDEFLASDVLKKEMDARWIKEFLKGLQSIGGTSIVVRAGDIMPGAFGLPAGGVEVELNGESVDPEAVAPLSQRGAVR